MLVFLYADFALVFELDLAFVVLISVLSQSLLSGEVILQLGLGLFGAIRWLLLVSRLEADRAGDVQRIVDHRLGQIVLVNLRVHRAERSLDGSRVSRMVLNRWKPRMLIGQLGVIAIGALEVHHLTDFLIPKSRHNDISLHGNFLARATRFARLLLVQLVGVIGFKALSLVQYFTCVLELLLDGRHSELLLCLLLTMKRVWLHIPCLIICCIGGFLIIGITTLTRGLDLSTLLVLQLSSVQTVLDVSVLFGLRFELSLICIVEGFCQDSQNDVQEEEGADNDQADREENGHPGDVRIHQVVHDLGPSFECYHLKHGDQTDTQVVKDRDAIVDHLLILHVVDCHLQVSIERRMAVPVGRTVVVALRFLAAEERDVLIERPSAVRIRHVSKATALVDTASELLDAEDAEEEEDEEHEQDGVTKIRQGAQQGSDEPAHFGKRIDALERT